MAPREFIRRQWKFTFDLHAQEAQKHRAEVRRILKDLEEAYTRLEHANEALLFARERAKDVVDFTLPADARPGVYTLRTKVSTGYGAEQKDVTFEVY